MNLTFDDARLDLNGGTWLCLKVREPAPAKRFVLERHKRLYDLEVKEHREKRSLDANAYYWELCGKLSNVIRESPDSIYRRHIREIGNYDTLCILDEAVDAWSRRWCSNHLGRFVETRESKIPGCTTCLAYYGSSDFDKAQMSTLIDNCIQDCKAVGVETLTPDKLALLKEAWSRASND